jgi:hypothetical protein
VNLGHGEKLSRKQDGAIAALLTEPTIEAAAVKAGVSESTLKNWLKREQFQLAYRAARQTVLERTVGRLLALSTEALATLQALLSCDSPQTRCRAALGILEQSSRGVELLDLAGRLEAMEARLQETKP